MTNQPFSIQMVKYRSSTYDRFCSAVPVIYQIRADFTQSAIPPLAGSIINICWISVWAMAIWMNPYLRICMQVDKCSEI
ncbi:hypothetical protein T10_4842 [Trichinella papuae]|uniref:Uncharacterized protein n=1 Tax=Trichinella papuae TaxID=268474 RepID=A0A0V1N9M3_9BILA|nr:hypothetical protein T10_4842 [Trichinella papuae]